MHRQWWLETQSEFFTGASPFGPVGAPGSFSVTRDGRWQMVAGSRRHLSRDPPYCWKKPSLKNPTKYIYEISGYLMLSSRESPVILEKKGSLLRCDRLRTSKSWLEIHLKLCEVMLEAASTSLRMLQPAAAFLFLVVFFWNPSMLWHRHM